MFGAAAPRLRPVNSGQIVVIVGSLLIDAAQCRVNQQQTRLGGRLNSRKLQVGKISGRKFSGRRSGTSWRMQSNQQVIILPTAGCLIALVDKVAPI